MLIVLPTVKHEKKNDIFKSKALPIFLGYLGTLISGISPWFVIKHLSENIRSSPASEISLLCKYSVFFQVMC